MAQMAGLRHWPAHAGLTRYARCVDLYHNTGGLKLGTSSAADIIGVSAGGSLEPDRLLQFQVWLMPALQDSSTSCWLLRYEHDATGNQSAFKKATYLRMYLGRCCFARWQL